MNNSRRDFLVGSGAALLGSAATAQQSGSKEPPAAAAAPAKTHKETPAPGTPPAFGTAPPVGPAVSQATFAEAEKLVQIELTARERAQAAENWRNSMAALYERRTGPRRVALDADLPPYSLWNPVLPGHAQLPSTGHFARTERDAGPLPANDAQIAFAPLWRLSRWIEARKLTAERLTHIYLERIARFDPRLRCVISLTRELALAQAKRADQEIAAGHYRGPLHGIPWGGKDLLDTAGILTTYGAEPYKDRLPNKDAALVKRLD